MFFLFGLPNLFTETHNNTEFPKVNIRLTVFIKFFSDYNDNRRPFTFYILSHSDRNKRLIATLIDNAIKYEPSGGEVLITLAQSGLKAEFAVKNYGSVIAEEDIPHLFDRFYRADKSRSTDGVGLGLAIAKNIADNHGGTLKVTSGAGIGTTFKAEFQCHRRGHSRTRAIQNKCVRL